MYVCFCTFKFKYIICKYSCMFCFEPGSHSVVQANLVYRKRDLLASAPELLGLQVHSGQPAKPSQYPA